MEFIDAWAKIEGKQDVKLCQHHTLHIHLVVHYHRLECTYTHYNIKKQSENYSWLSVAVNARVMRFSPLIPLCILVRSGYADTL